MLDLIPDYVKNAPFYHLVVEAFLLVWILWLIFRKSYSPPEKNKLTEKDKKELLEEWTPEPLVPNYDFRESIVKPRVVDGPVAKYAIVDGVKSLNVASFNFLNMVGNQKISEMAIKSIQKYGVGSCGPRGFYGTIDVHLELEQRLAKYFNVEEGIIYSYGFSTIASAIPAYSKRGDIIFADEGVHFAIQKGIVASRSDVRYFKHNDIEDLERLLKEQEDADKKNPKKAKVTRKFLVIEGLYMNYGDLCPLPKMVELKYKYKYRIFLDESVSFATIGKTGRGITEYYNVPREKIDLISGSMEMSLGSVGGFCVGSSYVVQHQVLSGQGYCFSASLPPLLAVSAIEALNIIEEKQDEIFPELERKCKIMHQKLKALNNYTVSGIDISPIKHVRLSFENTLDRLEKIVDYAQSKAISLTVARYLKEEKFSSKPSIRISVNYDLTEAEIQQIVDVLDQAVN
ncbi:Serine palmitoyltransferase 1 [Brachionus plicatilis]|uniref:Serine palmitoyltransferase 1 n=1 Tax=Brachionus plicatilis TaxID=10195 RepID=A0A3M7PCF1_BRAPC|nr:Serine palmitoyltransferase 1 [Brachionus plicatilis]